MLYDVELECEERCVCVFWRCVMDVCVVVGVGRRLLLVGKGVIGACDGMRNGGVCDCVGTCSKGVYVGLCNVGDTIVQVWLLG